MLSRNLVKQIQGELEPIVNTDKIKERWGSSVTFLHGLVAGLDGLVDYPNKAVVINSTDVDQSTYHVLIRDESLPLNKSKIDSLTGKDISNVLVRFSSSNLEEVEQFLQKWVDKDFKVVR